MAILKPGLSPIKKNVSSEKFSDKFRKFNMHKFFPENLKKFCTSFLVLLACKIYADFL
jgi:hypothetical protein